MQLLNRFRKDEWQFEYFLRYLAVINFNVCCPHDYDTISYYAEIPVEDCQFICENFTIILEKYKHRKELQHFIW